MLRYFNATIKSRSDKEVVKRALESLLNIKDEDIFVFPFCLFYKSFYANLKEKRKRPYTGYVKDREFEFEKTIFYGKIVFLIVLIVLVLDILNFTLRNYLKIKNRIQESKLYETSRYY